ncbi:MAG: radical SAM protein [Bacillota bacterium]
MPDTTSRINSLIFSSMQIYNVLPITSRCNVSCIFCSHKQNPPGVEVTYLPHRNAEAIIEGLDYLQENRKIVVGESATRIIEGEPFTHPQIFTILTSVRRRFSKTTIQLTTNGTLLDRKAFAKLKDLRPVEINLSLNSCQPAKRQVLMKDRNPETAIALPDLLSDYGIPFHGSIVAMPWITGWEDVRQSILNLTQRGAQTVRVLLPGYTRNASPLMRFSPETAQELEEMVQGINQASRVPVMLEPFRVVDLAARLEGVIEGSPAARVGLRQGDVITAIDGSPVICRVDAFRRALRGNNPRLQLAGMKDSVVVEKEAGTTSGLVMGYDLDPAVIEGISKEINRFRAKRVILLCSVLGAPALRLALAKFPFQEEVRLVETKNHFFGGSIQAAGLLVVEDFSCGLAGFLREEPDFRPDLILLPAIAFDARGRDLTGRFFWEVETSCPVALI